MNLVARSILRFRLILDKKWAKLFDIQRFIRINQLPNNPLNNLDLEPPAIELLLVTKSKDIELLEIVITQALINSLNPITSIKIVVPAKEVVNVLRLLNEKVFSGFLIVVSEDDFIPENIRSKLKNEFGDSYGWILQQLIKIWSVINSKSKGILVLDADTILLSTKLFLDKFENQILHPTFEYHLPYYKFLENYKPNFGKLENSFISHHMIMQPKFAVKAFRIIGTSLDEFVQEICTKYDRFEKNPICIEFEVYAQFMITHNPEKVKLAKWSNLSVKRNRILLADNKINFYSYPSNFNSISLHSWL